MNSKWSAMSSSSSFQALSSTVSSVSRSSAEMSRPSRSSESGVGTLPIAVSWAAAVPATRSTTHLRTRLVSPKPGQMNRPSSSLRNQFTQKTLGSFSSSVDAPISSQWPM